MMSLSDDKQSDIIGAFNTTSRYLDDIFFKKRLFFDNMVLKPRFWTCICLTLKYCFYIN